MVDISIKMTLPADTRNEILQTIKGLLIPIRLENDCVSCHCYVDVERDSVVLFRQEWNTEDALATHLRSGHFKVLLGAMKLLSIDPEIRFNTVIAMEGGKVLAAFKGNFAGA